MPLIDAQPDALAKIYAESLYELAEAEGGRERLEAMAGELDELVELTREMPQLSEFMASRIVSLEKRAKSLEVIFKGRVSELLYRFLQILNRKERLNAFLPMATAFDQMVQEQFGRIEVDIHTRGSVEPGELESFKARLQGALGREPVVHTYTDPTMLGGVKIQIGDRLIDASLSTRLRRMRELLLSEGAGLMRERFERSFDEQENQ